MLRHQGEAARTDFRKLDAKLAAALREERDPAAATLEIFVHLAPDHGPIDAAKFDALGVRGAGSGRTVLTATVSPRTVDELSDQPWVRQLRLSRKLRLLGDGNR